METAALDGAVLQCKPDVACSRVHAHETRWIVTLVLVPRRLRHRLWKFDEKLAAVQTPVLSLAYTLVVQLVCNVLPLSKVFASIKLGRKNLGMHNLYCVLLRLVNARNVAPKITSLVLC